jgi:mannosyl-3-phosphoglycerate phosphatase
MIRKRVLIFTDLDGTLLDPEDYSFKEALPALAKIKDRKIPLILCSSKTRAELELYQRKLKIHDPFISENGGAIFIPFGYFRRILFDLKEKDKYLVLELGTNYQKIRRGFRQVLSKLNLKAKGFGDLKADQIASLVGLSIIEADLAKKREYDEPFYFVEKTKKAEIKLAEKEFNKKGLSLTSGGRLFHLTGGNDKGKAVRILIQIYKANWPNDLLSIGLGDSLNDLPLLESVDSPVLIRKRDNSYERSILGKLKVYKALGIGPAGWNRAILDLLSKFGPKQN